MTSRPPPLPKNEEKHREEILDRVEEGWLEEDWTRTMPHLLNELLQKNFTFTRNLISTRVSHATEGIQWIRMEELGKALTNRCRAVRELSNKNPKNLTGTRDRNIDSEQLEFECQLRTPTRGRIYGTPQSRSVILTRPIPIINNQSRLAKTTGRYVAEP